MHENQGNSVIFYAHYTEAGVSKTGLTVTINIYEVARDGTAAQVATDQACTEIGAGLYRYLLAGATVDAAAEYVGVFHTATATVDCQDIPSIWVIDRAGLEKLDSGGVPVASIATDAITAAALKADAVTEISDGIWDEALSGHATAGTAGKTLADVDVSGVAAAVWAYANRTLSSFGTLISSIWAWGSRTLSGVTTTQFNLIGPVRNDGKIEALAGDDYYAADGRAMSWKDTSWPDLTGATVKFISGSTEITMTVTNPGSGVEQTLSMDVPKATSTSMKGEFKFILQATLASTHVVTLLEGEGRFK